MLVLTGRRASGRAFPRGAWERDRKQGNSFAMAPTPEEVGLYIFILAGFLGYHVITRVPPLLHTPLMSATNAISGISLIGSLVVAGANYSRLSTMLGFIAVTCSSTNVVGGFLITDRMLKMFKKREEFGTQHRMFNPKLLFAF